MSVELMPHNEKAYEEVKECYKESNICCVIQPPSTRKTSIALKLVEDNKDKKTLYLAPGSAILHQVKEVALDEGVYTAENFNRKTYQSLSKMSDEEIANLEVDIIVLDEFHHCGSPVWGEAVRKLIETHPNAKVLGLSATPIRYFDGNIDMAEELFNGNIASEISFEQAIEQGILEEFDYVAATYAMDFEKIITDEMLSDGYVPGENKEVFDKLYEELKVKLGENIVNLPNVLEKHIKQRSGKYVFFCKNLEDKEHQIKEAERIFSKVNPNIKIYDIDYTHTDKENQRTIQSFRRATSDDGTLKILFNVDMLVEGFHLPDLSGGFTTRPTKSPRIAIQEAGRILRAKETRKKEEKDTAENSQKRRGISSTEDSLDTENVDKVDDIRPVFIDFVDTLRQLDVIRSAITNQKTNIRRARTEGKNHSEEKIRIYDTTLQIAEIVDKMKSLVVERTAIEEKIMYIEQYLQKSKETSIAGNVVDDEGRPIGLWCIQIRSAITKGRVYDESIMKKLKNLGKVMDDLKELFGKIGYTEDEVNRIINTYGVVDLKPETLLKNVKRNYEFFLELGYSQEEVIRMTKSFPEIYGLSIENIKQKIEDIKKLGYSQEEVIKITKSFPAVYSYSIENIKQKIEDLKKLGYSQEEVMKMTKNLPQIYSYSIENIKQKIEDRKKLGYSQEEVIKMTKRLPTIYGLSIENTKQKIEDLKQLGYSQEEVIKMTKSFPEIYSLSIENIKQKIEDIKKLGYSQEEVIKMTRDLPAIYSYSIENIKQKVDFYNSIDLHLLAVEDPKNLMQSTALSYARYMFFKDKGIIIDKTNYRKLFTGQKVFEKQYGVKKDELLEKYDYKKYMETKSTQELGKETVDVLGETLYIKETEQSMEFIEKKITQDEQSNNIEY